MAIGRGSWVMWVMGQPCNGSHGSWVTKDDPFPSLMRSDCIQKGKCTKNCLAAGLCPDPPGELTVPTGPCCIYEREDGKDKGGRWEDGGGKGMKERRERMCPTRN